LDVDHIDGDRFNNDPANLQTLCANCHRLKTHLAGDSNSGIN
jgi:5-methylcytosine-specific restriction endonuclease McrA